MDKAPATRSNHVHVHDGQCDAQKNRSFFELLLRRERGSWNGIPAHTQTQGSQTSAKPYQNSFPTLHLPAPTEGTGVGTHTAHTRTAHKRAVSKPPHSTKPSTSNAWYIPAAAHNESSKLPQRYGPRYARTDCAVVSASWIRRKVTGAGGLQVQLCVN